MNILIVTVNRLFKTIYKYYIDHFLILIRNMVQFFGKSELGVESKKY